MATATLFPEIAKKQALLQPRDYQIRDHDESFRLWNTGEIGVLTRSATGTGKTPMSCKKADTWLSRGHNQRVMVISYERQLVWQFAQEIEDFLGITPGIEMEKQSIDADDIPKIVVASRQTLMPAPTPDPETLAEIVSYGVPLESIGAANARHCKTILNALKNGDDAELIQYQLRQLNDAPEACGKLWSRLHKFDWRLNWLVIFDEAHKHAYHLRTVKPIVDWFEKNPEHRRSGITATPKRSDAISIGDKMFPAIALDYPLFSARRNNAVGDGWAVPYVQRYIEVAGVDFKSFGKIGDDFDPESLQSLLGEESTLARITQPLLDMVGDRRTLIFSPTVAMSKDVARFINARCEVVCSSCGTRQWHPRLLIGDGSVCSSRQNGNPIGCGKLLDPDEITKSGEQARAIDGTVDEQDRKVVYEDHTKNKFQFLSVVGLCREGYNDPEISCVAIFRPVSEAASSLAEQMKGRGCRPLRGILNGLHTREERLWAIANSAKPNCLIVDLVGVTGLADCASSVQIYADGLADDVARDHDLSKEEADAVAREIMERAKELLTQRGTDEPMPVADAIAQAKREDDEQREKVRKEREEAERRASERAKARAKAGAEVSYTEHEVGTGSQVDPDAASEQQYKYMSFLGMEIKTQFSRRKAGRIITMLKNRTPFEEVARLNGLSEEQWSKRVPSEKQIGFMRGKGIPTANAKTPYDASLLIDAKLNADKFVADRLEAIAKARNSQELNAAGLDTKLAHNVLEIASYVRIIEAGRVRRAQLTPISDEPIPE